MQLISESKSRKELADEMGGVSGKELSLLIRQLKQSGRLIQRRVSAEPMTEKKKVVFNFVATNSILSI